MLSYKDKRDLGMILVTNAIATETNQSEEMNNTCKRSVREIQGVVSGNWNAKGNQSSRFECRYGF